MVGLNHHGNWGSVRIICGDGRFDEALRDYAVETFGGLSDSVPAPGGVKEFLADPVRREIMLRDIAMYMRLHGQNTIFVPQHEDCGAYGGKGAFANSDEEFKRHKSDLEQAVSLLQKHFPNARIVTGFISLNHEVTQFANLVPEHAEA